MPNQSTMIRNNSTMALQNSSQNLATLKPVPQYVDLNQIRNPNTKSNINRISSAKKQGLSLLQPTEGQKENHLENY